MARLCQTESWISAFSSSGTAHSSLPPNGSPCAQGEDAEVWHLRGVFFEDKGSGLASVKIKEKNYPDGVWILNFLEQG